MVQDFLIPLILMGLAEFGDKTQLAILSLSTKTREYAKLFLGVTLGFVLTTGTAVLLGNYLSKYLNMHVLQWITGILFITLGVLLLTKSKDIMREHIMKRAFITGFLTTTLLELGDKSQLAAALFGAIYDTLPAFLGVLLAMITLALLTIMIGKKLQERINETLLHRTSAILYIIIGTITLLV